MAESRRAHRGALRGLPSSTERLKSGIEPCAPSGPRITGRALQPAPEPAPAPGPAPAHPPAPSSPRARWIRLGLAFIGGAMGGILGGGAMAVSLVILRSGAPLWIDVLATMGTVTAAFAVLGLVLWRVHILLKRTFPRTR
ncbi:hypothetical protein [Pendulispora albinea]|uniref:Uncharacterized protein n=1 Tax=Pendulispora albinea TaxID=2741071 RepID=A0ABZ2LTT5_9BACT